MFNFIRKFPDTALINGTITYIKSTNCKRKVEATAYDALQQDYKSACQAPRIRFGVLAALYTDDGHELLGALVIKGMGSDKKLAATLAADQALHTFAEKIKNHAELKDNTKAWLAWTGLCADVAANLCDKSTSNVAKHLIAMKKPADYNINIGHLQQLCVQRIADACDIVLTDEFAEHALNMPVTAAKVLSQPTEKQLPVRMSEDVTVQMMMELGFKINDTICAMKKEKDAEVQTLRINKMEHGKINLLNVIIEMPEVQIDLSEFQQKKWKHITNNVDNTVWYGYVEENCHHFSTSNMQNIVRSSAVIALHNAWNEETLVANGVQMTTAPRAVVSLEKFSVGALVLAPNTQSVSMKELKDNDQTQMYAQTGGVFLGVTTFDSKLHAVVAGSVAPYVKKENCRNTRNTTLIPYWLVEVTNTEDVANMRLTMDLSKHVIDANEPVIKVPLIKNSKALKAGDKLVLFVPAPASLNPKPPLKKQKTKKM